MNKENKPLWAPWRIEFIRSEKDKECFLCNNETVSEKYEEKLIIARLETVFVIMNKYPYSPGHLLIAPYRHIGDIAELSEQEQKELMSAVIKCKKVLEKAMNPDGYNVGFNLGVVAGAGVADHIHMHILPRWQGDNNFMPIIANTRVIPESIEDTKIGMLFVEYKTENLWLRAKK